MLHIINKISTGNKYKVNRKALDQTIGIIADPRK